MQCKREDQDLRNIYLGMNPRYVIHKLCEFGLFSLSLYVCILSFNKEIMISTLQYKWTATHIVNKTVQFGV